MKTKTAKSLLSKYRKEEEWIVVYVASDGSEWDLECSRQAYSVAWRCQFRRHSKSRRENPYVFNHTTPTESRKSVVASVVRQIELAIARKDDCLSLLCNDPRSLIGIAFALSKVFSWESRRNKTKRQKLGWRRG